MSWKVKWEDFKMNMFHPEKAQELKAEEERKAKERDEALHRSDKSTGSETLDD